MLSRQGFQGLLSNGSGSSRFLQTRSLRHGKPSSTKLLRYVYQDLEHPACGYGFFFIQPAKWPLRIHRAGSCQYGSDEYRSFHYGQDPRRVEHRDKPWQHPHHYHSKQQNYTQWHFKSRGSYEPSHGQQISRNHGDQQLGSHGNMYNYGPEQYAHHQNLTGLARERQGGSVQSDFHRNEGIHHVALKDEAALGGPKRGGDEQLVDQTVKGHIFTQRQTDQWNSAQICVSQANGQRQLVNEQTFHHQRKAMQHAEGTVIEQNLAAEQRFYQHTAVECKEAVTNTEILQKLLSDNNESDQDSSHRGSEAGASSSVAKVSVEVAAQNPPPPAQESTSGAIWRRSDACSLSMQLRRFVMVRRETRFHMMVARMRLCKLLLHFARITVPDVDISFIGATVNGLWEFDSGLDMSLFVESFKDVKDNEDTEIDKRGLLFELKRKVHRTEFGAGFYIPRKGIPVLTFICQRSGLLVNLTVHNMSAVRSTHFVRMYAEVSTRVLNMCLIVKNWAKVQNIHGSARKRLSSYALSLMVIHYLQACTPPVIPVLHADYPEQMEVFDPKRDDVEALESIVTSQHLKLPRSANKLELSELLHGFFKYYATYPFSKKVISVRTREVINRTEEHGSDCLYIEEPFHLTNVAQAVSKEKLALICSAFTKTLEDITRTPSLAAIGLALRTHSFQAQSVGDLRERDNVWSGDRTEWSRDWAEWPGYYAEQPMQRTRWSGDRQEWPSDTEWSGDRAGRSGQHREWSSERAERPRERAEQLRERAERPGQHAKRPGKRAKRPGEHAEKLRERTERPGQHAESPGGCAQQPRDHAKQILDHSECPPGHTVQSGDRAKQPVQRVEQRRCRAMRSTGRAKRPRDHEGEFGDNAGNELASAASFEEGAVRSAGLA